MQTDEEKWKKWNKRFWTTISMIGGFFTMLHLVRTVGLVLLIFVVQVGDYRPCPSTVSQRDASVNVCSLCCLVT